MRIALIFASAIAYACQPVDGPNITGKDLASADPSFANVDAAKIIAAAPIPGVRRVLLPQNLKQFGSASGPLCFERATTFLDESDLKKILVGQASSLRRGFQSAPDALQINLLDFTRTPVPRGPITFSAAGPDQSGLWRGHIQYDATHTFPIWAKVRITTEQTWIEAVEPLAPGKPIEASQLKTQTGPRFPFAPAPATEVVGKIPLRAIKPGEPILRSMLTEPKEVERGEKVNVEVKSGEALLSFDAVAESSGRAGDSVLIKNPENGRRFQARVEAKRKVVVTAQ